MKPVASRRRIFAYLQEHPAATAAQISAALNLTRADVRYHLSALLQAGSVEAAAALAPGAARARGRPTLAYRLRSTARPDNLAALASALLTLAQGGSDAPAPLAALAGALIEAPPPGRNLTQRIAALVQQLNHWNYQARWEARAGAPALLLRNCPYAAILAQHPELCQIDRLLVERATGRQAQQAARMDLATGSPPVCIFLVLPQTGAMLPSP